MIHLGPYRAIICGGRTYGQLVEWPEGERALRLEQMNFMAEYLDAFVARFGKPDKVFEGGALGADAVGAMWCRARGVPVTTCKPDWSKGRAAGIQRNGTMLTVLRAFRSQFEPVVIGFPGGVGTAHMLETANLACCRVFKVEHGVIPVW